MPENKFEILNRHVLSKLKGLDPELTYHSIAHTKDVIKQTARIAREEGLSEDDVFLLKVAALYHDTGFLECYDGHESKSCEIFLNDSEAHKLSEKDKETVLKLIMSTKVPQQPKNEFQKILCDADLDYLGRKDFLEVADRLKNEFLHFSKISGEKEWKDLQLKFIHDHHYHTGSSQKLREPVKRMNLDRLK